MVLKWEDKKGSKGLPFLKLITHLLLVCTKLLIHLWTQTVKCSLPLTFYLCYLFLPCIEYIEFKGKAVNCKTIHNWEQNPYDVIWSLYSKFMQCIDYPKNIHYSLFKKTNMHNFWVTLVNFWVIFGKHI